VTRGLSISWQPSDGSAINYFVSIQSHDDGGVSLSYVNESLGSFVTSFDTRDVPGLVLAQGVAYDVVVQAFSCSGVSDPASAVASPVSVPPGPPVDVEVSVGNTTATVTWQAPPYVNATDATTNFTVFVESVEPPALARARASTSTPTAGVTNQTTVACCNATFTGLLPGDAYVFGVFATDGGGSGPPATSPTAVPGVGLPQPPQQVNATAVGDAANCANVSWSPCPHDGGSPLVSYTCVCVNNVTGAVIAVVEAPGTNTSVVMTSLPINVSLAFVVVAQTARGSSTESSPSAAVTLAPLPLQPPLNVFAYAVPVIPSPSTACTQAAVVVEFTPSADHGGINVTAQSFLVSSVSPSGAVRVIQSVYFSPSQPLCVDNDVAQAYAVSEMNSFGRYGSMSPPSGLVRANGGVQCAVTRVTVEPDSSVIGTFAVSWTFAGVSTAAPVQHFSVMAFNCSLGDADFATPVLNATAPAGSSTATVSGGSGMGVLVPYCFVVAPVNAAGVGAWSSPPVNVSQNSTAPTSVDVTSAVGGNDSVVVTWRPPVSDGGTPITMYTITLRDQEPGGSLGPPVSVRVLPQRDPTANYSLAVAQLTNGVVYQIAAAATNYDGWTSTCFPGDASAECARTAKPCTTPDAPEQPEVEGRDTMIEVTWRPPRDGGCELTNYTVYLLRRDDATEVRVQHVAVAAGTRWTWRHLGFSQAFHVRVSASNSHGEGVPSPWSRRVVTTQAIVPVAWWQLAAGVGGFLLVCTLLLAADSACCRRCSSRFCCCCCTSPPASRRSVKASAHTDGHHEEAFAVADGSAPVTRVDGTLSLVSRRASSSSSVGRRREPSSGAESGSVGEMRHVSDGSLVAAADAPELSSQTRYRSFIAVLLCLLRLIFAFIITTASYAQHSLRQAFLWLQLATIGACILIGAFTSFRFFTSLRETYAVLYKTPRLHANAGSRRDVVAPSYEKWSRDTLCTTMPIRMLSALKPAVLDVLVSRACGAAAFSMPVSDVFGGWR
jgi:hypothetical protein